MDDLALLHVEELKALLAVADHQNFTSAAKVLFKHPTVISKRISALEARLGVRLVERTTRQVHMTVAGAHLAAETRRALEMLNEAQARVASEARALHGRLRIAIPATFGRLWIAPRLPRFLEDHPGLHVQIDLTDRFIDLLAEGYDAAIRIGTLPDSTLVARRLTDHRRILCAAPDYLHRRGALRHPSDLSQHDCLEFTGFATFPQWQLSNGREHHKTAVTGQLRSDDTTILLEAARAGLGIIAAGEWFLGQDIAAGRLVRVLPGWALDDGGGIYLVRPSGRYEAAPVAAFAAWLMQVFGNGPLWHKCDQQVIDPDGPAAR